MWYTGESVQEVAGVGGRMSMASNARTLFRVSLKGGLRELSAFCSGESAEGPLRYGMGGNEADAANPLCQVTRVVQHIANRKRESSNLRQAWRGCAAHRSAPPAHVYGNAVGVHLACADRTLITLSPSYLHSPETPTVHLLTFVCQLILRDNAFAFRWRAA